MKRLFFIFAAVAALLNIACEENTVENFVVEQLVDFSVVAESGADSRVALDGNRTSWEVGDRITLALTPSNGTTSFSTLEIKSSEDITSNGKRAVFRGKVPAGSYLSVGALYPGVDNPSTNIVLERDALDNLFMLSHQIDYSTPVLTIEEGQSKEVKLSFNHLMHKMDFNLTLADGYSSKDLESKNIAVEFSATSSNGAIAFIEENSLNIVRGMLSTVSTANTVRVCSSKPQFSTMIFPINYETNMVFTFDVYIDGEKRYEIRKPESGTLSTFTMLAGESTTVNLELNAKNCVGGGAEVVAEPITLKASQSKIKANGTDSATLSVVKTNGGEDVTSESTIFVNGSKLYGTTFTATTAGTYTLYAERLGERSAEIKIVAEQSGNTGKSIVFADGVSISSGWYDVNKKARGNNGDINMCWAAAASNMIQWFQDRYVAAGNTLPSKAVDGPGTKTHGSYGPYELALMDMYHSEWNNEKGGQVWEAIPWYFEGVLNGGEYATAGSQAYPLDKNGGGYWKSIWSSVKSHMYCGYSYILSPGFIEYYDLYTASYASSWGSASGFTNLVVQIFERGMASMTVRTSANGGLLHAVTFWGYEIDNSTGLITRVWITDSDDLEVEPKQQLLNEYNVSYDGGSSIRLSSSSTKYGSLWVAQLQPFSGYGSAGK